MKVIGGSVCRPFSSSVLGAVSAVRNTFAACFVALLSSGWAYAAGPPNVVVMIADDMGCSDCSAYGHPTIHTPHIDEIAANGLRFDAAILTCSSCSPSRCSILTGRYPSATGARELHMPLPADKTLLTTPLRRAGYWTVSSGKWHLGPHVQDQFDLVITDGIGASGSERWIEALRARPEGEPFFAWLAAIDPHRGYQPGAFDPPHKESDSRVPPYLPDTPEVRADLALYYDEIARFDANVGKVVAELEKQGIADQTMVVIMSDNGRPFPRSKTTVYDSGVRTPLIVRLPGVTARGAVSRSLVSSIDLAPTILEVAGIPIEPTFQGTSFAEVLHDPAQTTRTHAFSEHNWHDYRACERSVRTDRYRYIRNLLPELPGTPPADAVRSPTYRVMLQLDAAGKLPSEAAGPLQAPRPAEELYNLQSDPHEMNNLADDPQAASVLAEMRSALDRWQEKIEDPGVRGASDDRFDRRTGERL